MLLFELLEIGFAVLMVLFALTQIAYPTLVNQPLFPMFRRRQKLLTQLEGLKEKEKEEEIELLIKAEKSKFDKKEER